MKRLMLFSLAGLLMRDHGASETGGEKLQPPHDGPEPERPTRELTFGQKAVGLPFNPSGSNAVNECKQGFADLIDQMHELRRYGVGEKGRLASIAITELQGAQMWAVKALTWVD